MSYHMVGKKYYEWVTLDNFLLFGLYIFSFAFFQLNRIWPSSIGWIVCLPDLANFPISMELNLGVIIGFSPSTTSTTTRFEPSWTSTSEAIKVEHAESQEQDRQDEKGTQENDFQSRQECPERNFDRSEIEQKAGKPGSKTPLTIIR